MEKTLWDYDELSARLGTKKTTLYGWVHLGLIPHIRFSKRYVRFDPDEIQSWLEVMRKSPRASTLADAKKSGRN